ncbi:hypothetical protein KC315_g3260 [Hortaea werneckii]|uniref:Uncharacterized protein n=1 Tax=Hortaea werneckii TaxID=91943 RepID=A0A3M7ANB8_HORWE|nr:hypothetical protein KC315_g3260 [Hortaea werneckii]KAI7367110.1 hypothetical protein KC354_g3694 [Hortaea werneckii]KAI7552976.1 hypothetical protein KC331_g1535 [Hortaea werneckii]KAI7721871.1 hypothetical protein KC353_g1017 [Hortaea werneckii]RMY28928.1 hypothetical protein D0865_15637 [Hortaea werneckii]
MSESCLDITTPPIFRLPLELRQQIYSHLLPKQPISHPLPSVGITSVSHKPPTSNLLSIHPQLTAEILDHFYSISSWKLIFSHAFNFFRVDPELRNLERSQILNRIRKVEVVFFCDILLLKEYPSFGLEAFCAEIRRRATRACEVLNKAPCLRNVTVSWIDTTLTGGWNEKATILHPLRSLADIAERPITFCIGELNGPPDVDREKFVKALRDVLGESGHLDMGQGDAAIEGPSRLRMLAFDVRQERQKIGDYRRLASCRGCGGYELEVERNGSERIIESESAV